MLTICLVLLGGRVLKGVLDEFQRDLPSSLASESTSMTGHTKRRQPIKSGADEQLEEDGSESDEDDEDILGRNVARL
jgi:hypothetical protein